MRASAPIPRIDRPTQCFGCPPLPPSRPPVAARRMSVKGRSCPAGPCAALSRRGGPVIARPVSGAAADGLVVIERLCGHQVARRRPVLPEVNARHRLKRHGWPPAVWPKLWVVRRLQPPPRNHRIHFCQKLFAPWYLLHCMAKTGNGGLFAHRRGRCQSMPSACQINSKAAGFSDVPQLSKLINVQIWRRLSLRCGPSLIA